MISCDDGENTTLSDADDPYVGVKCVILREQQIGRIGLSCRSEGRQRTGVRSRGSGLASVVTLTTPCRANPLMEGVPEPSSELEEKLTIDGSAHQAWNPGEDKVARGESPRQDATSPHVSLRQAARPVIVAHGILSKQRLVASALAEEAEALLDLTENLLRKLGWVHLLSTGFAQPVAAPAQTDQADRLVEAYAHVGMSWALVVSSVTKLAELLIDECDWSTAHLLAELVAESGEATIAKHIETLIGDARNVRFSAELAAIRAHPGMTAAEVREVVARLSELPKHPQRKSAIIARRMYLISSVYEVASQSKVESAITLANTLYGRGDTLQKHTSLEDHSDYKLPEETLFAEILTILQLCEG